MMTKGEFQRSRDVKEVIHIKAHKFTGYFNTECKKFAVDPYVTSHADLKKILASAFNLDGLFKISYLCRDDTGEDVYLALQTDWDLDAAFLTSSNPCLMLQIELKSYRSTNKIKHQRHNSKTFSESVYGFDISTGFHVPQGWSEFAGNAIAKITSGIGQTHMPDRDEQSLFPQTSPLGDCELHEYLDKQGRLVRPEDLRLRVYHGGVEPTIRKVVWRLLLNVFPQNLTAEERVAYMKIKTKEYHQLYTRWKSLNRNRYVQDLQRMIWKDVLRTDRSHPYFAEPDSNPHLTSLHNLLLTYALTHEEVRYCQGMSDIAAPILVVMNNEPHAYVCFCGLMKRLESNFYTDGAVMSKKFEHLALLLQYHDLEYFMFLKSITADNMYFCYRWLLLEMKREFDFDGALMVLEVMWSSLPPQPPDGDLPLGVISTQNEHVPAKVGAKCAPAKTKRNSLPNLTLSVKNLQATLRVGTSSSGNLTDLIRKNAIVDDYLSSVPPYRSTPFPMKLDRSNYLLMPDRGGLSDAESSNPQHVVGSMLDPYNLDKSHDIKGILLPPPEELGCGNPFLLFVCLAVLLEQKPGLMAAKSEYADLVIHFDKMVRKHSPAKILSRAMQLFASYLKSQTTF